MTDTESWAAMEPSPAGAAPQPPASSEPPPDEPAPQSPTRPKPTTDRAAPQPPASSEPPPDEAAPQSPAPSEPPPDEAAAQSPASSGSSAAFLLGRLHAAGLTDVVAVEPATGGLAATAGIARRADGTSVFVKAFGEPPAEDAFAAEAEGLAVLRDAGGAATPDVVHAGRDLLVLSVVRPRPGTAAFWERFAHDLARLHTTTRHPRFGWHRDNWLGRRRQVNTWEDDGFAFFARHRLLRWLDEPRVLAALDTADRDALERLCDRLPELLPQRPACLTHGDLWAQNVMATADGRPALIDPAVSYTWAEVDLAHLWTTAPPPEAAVFFARYAELTGLDAGWRARMPILQLRQHLAVIAQFEPDWGAADLVRTTLAPFRRRRGSAPGGGF